MKKLVFIIILYFVSTVQINELYSQNTSTQLNTKGFFTLDKIGGKWLLISPDQKPFFSIGLNHFDPASLRYAENIHCLLYTSPSPRDRTRSRMPSSA